MLFHQLLSIYLAAPFLSCVEELGSNGYDYVNINLFLDIKECHVVIVSFGLSDSEFPLANDNNFGPQNFNT